MKVELITTYYGIKLLILVIDDREIILKIL